MRYVLKVLIRLASLAIGLVAYMELIVSNWGEKGDANIGAGLLAFLALALVGLFWAVYDGHQVGALPAVVCWGVVSALFSQGWLVLRAFSEADESMSAGELMRADAPLIPFTFMLVFIPAVLGAVIGHATRRGTVA
ncbi:hypothetical protein [Nocardioides sp. LHG3406-4]|uniref:hypothetical protein n=1 Tax=Nocardioides sp. LHG3406-4 TaxID=2804575 RepID=UPI003CF284D9